MIPTLSNSICWVSFYPPSGGVKQCAGVLLNNEAQDLSPFILTARHCVTSNNNDFDMSGAEITAAEQSAEFRFRFRRIDCNSTVSTNMVSYDGAVFRAANY
ncbi:trypsin-like serine protease [Dyadobacter fermentans]|uniref:trypsin-like serine protease n=1 Tax=Dyadobacter fermentans TaxID=94254 RepID=UPI001CBB3034